MTEERRVLKRWAQIHSHHKVPDGANMLSRYAQRAASGPVSDGLVARSAMTRVCCVGQHDGRNPGTFEARLTHA
jgi:hypothetical protein